MQAKAKDGDQARADRIAYQLVYGYTHHLFPIDYYEAERIGLSVDRMDKDLYDEAIKVVEACHKKDFVCFLSKEQSEAVSVQVAQNPGAADEHSPANGRKDYDHPKGEAARPTSADSASFNKKSQSG